MRPILNLKPRSQTWGIAIIAIFLSVTAQAQTCFEGNCTNGYGKKDFQEAFYVGGFSNSKFHGPGLRYGKENGAITMSYWDQGERTITIVEFQSGALEFGYRTKGSDGKMRLHNGFDFRDDGLSKKIDGQKYPLDFAFEGDACLIGDCQNGFGAEYLITISENKQDTSSYLFVGHYQDGKWEGEGGYYEFTSGDFYVGHFSNYGETYGGYFNEDTGLASIIEAGEEVKALSYSIPAEPPGVNTPTQTQPVAQATQKPKKKGAFWKALGEVALATAVVVAASENNKSTTKSSGSSSSSGSGSKVNCKYMVEWWTEADDTKLVIEGVAVIKATNVHVYDNVKGQHRFFNSYQEAANFKQEKANTGISEGYEIGYKPVYNELKQSGCAN